MAKIAIVESKPNAWADAVLQSLSARQQNEYLLASPLEICRQADGDSEVACIYAPPFCDHQGTAPDLQDAEAVFRQLAGLKSGTVVLISSALVYGIGPGRRAMAARGSAIDGIRLKEFHGSPSTRVCASSFFGPLPFFLHLLYSAVGYRTAWSGQCQGTILACSFWA